MNKTIEKTTLSHLIWNEDYSRKVIPFIKEDYFTDKNDKVIFQEIIKFIEKYNKTPTTTSIQIEIDNRKDLSQSQYKEIKASWDHKVKFGLIPKFNTASWGGA